MDTRIFSNESVHASGCYLPTEIWLLFASSLVRNHEFRVLPKYKHVFCIYVAAAKIMSNMQKSCSSIHLSYAARNNFWLPIVKVDFLSFSHIHEEYLSLEKNDMGYWANSGGTRAWRPWTSAEAPLWLQLHKRTREITHDTPQRWMLAAYVSWLSNIRTYVFPNLDAESSSKTVCEGRKAWWMKLIN